MKDDDGRPVSPAWFWPLAIPALVAVVISVFMMITSGAYNVDYTPTEAPTEAHDLP